MVQIVLDVAIIAANIAIIVILVKGRRNEK